MLIIGAGMAGLLAANMLGGDIHERQSSLPNNHHSVLRFRSSLVGDVLGIPFKKVKLIKDVVRWRNSVADALAYSLKTNETLRSDRSIYASAGVVEDRYIAPPDLIDQMALNQSIIYNSEMTNLHEDWGKCKQPIISTIPMPALMDLLDYPKRDISMFNHITGVTITATIANCEAYVTLLVPDPFFPFSRISITGNQLMIEASHNISHQTVFEAIEFLGIPPSKISNINTHTQRYAKITPVDDDYRKSFLAWATDQYNIFSLGRFATWRPGLLTDDLVKDIRLISGWIGSRYAIKRHRSN